MAAGPYLQRFKNDTHFYWWHKCVCTEVSKYWISVIRQAPASGEECILTYNFCRTNFVAKKYFSLLEMKYQLIWDPKAFKDADWLYAHNIVSVQMVRSWHRMFTNHRVSVFNEVQSYRPSNIAILRTRSTFSYLWGSQGYRKISVVKPYTGFSWGFNTLVQSCK